tara:strand:- start:66 stop:404 length:339 start_codon:yes stop_codon:yes gene_type:complete
MADTATADADTFQFDYKEIGADVGDLYSVALQEKTGTSHQDFTWQIEFSLDGGTTYSAYADGDGTKLFTGDGTKELRVAARTNRVKVVAIGPAGAKTVFVKIGPAKENPERE